VLFQLVPERIAPNAQNTRGLGLIAAGFLQGPDNQQALLLGKRADLG
jgi:hypothetical protein